MQDIHQIDYIDPENLSEIEGKTPFGLFDGDTQFQEDAKKITKRIAYNLGYPVHDLEITEENVYTNIEIAMMEFSKMINEYKVTEDYFNLVGLKTEEVHSNKLVYPNMDYFLRLADAYGTEAGVGGSIPNHTGYIDVQKGKQMYNLKQLYFFPKHPSEDSFTIREVYHYDLPPATIGSVTGEFLGVNTSDNLNAQFGFSGGSGHKYHTLLPLSWDIQRIQNANITRDIRTSGYGFKLEGEVLRLFPIPRRNFKLHFRYTLSSEEQGKNNRDRRYGEDSGDIVNDPTKINFSNFQWNRISPRDRTWVISYSQALTKVTLGENRRKFSSFQYPNGEISLNGDALVSDGKEEIRELKEEMKEYLEKLSKERSLDIQQQTDEALNNKLRRIPLGIYIV